MSWQPVAELPLLRKRADILFTIRSFFNERNVMEVETPLLASAGVTDLHLENMESQFQGPGFAEAKTLFLQTSPEYAMKRLLAAGSGCIYQICKAFRNDESGRYHNPEFTILEWYRIGFDHHQLMDEMDELLQLVLTCNKATRLTYQHAFIQYTQVDPLTATVDDLKGFLTKQDEGDFADVLDDKDDLLQYIFNQYVESNIGASAPCFIYDFPASQAALAKVNKSDPRVADRFEVYYKSIELANGFHELTDSEEQLLRFQQDNKKRTQYNKPEKPIDYHLIEALKSGLPDCAGVALGIDRLIMLATDSQHIEQVTSFTINNC